MTERTTETQLLPTNKNIPVSLSPLLLGHRFIHATFLQEGNTSRGHGASLLTLHGIMHGSCTDSHAFAQKTIQTYITSLIMPKRQTIAPISNSIIFYFSIINFCRHPANKCMIPS